MHACHCKASNKCDDRASHYTAENTGLCIYHLRGRTLRIFPAVESYLHMRELWGGKTDDINLNQRTSKQHKPAPSSEDRPILTVLTLRFVVIKLIHSPAMGTCPLDPWPPGVFPGGPPSHFDLYAGYRLGARKHGATSRVGSLSMVAGTWHRDAQLSCAWSRQGDRGGRQAPTNP